MRMRLFSVEDGQVDAVLCQVKTQGACHFLLCGGKGLLVLKLVFGVMSQHQVVEPRIPTVRRRSSQKARAVIDQRGR